jgi:L-Ala-D/L-Glu epimerase
MTPRNVAPLKLGLEIERWPFLEPFHITGYTFESIEVLRVSLEHDGCIGVGEAAGVYYQNDKPARMAQQLEALRAHIQAGIDRDSLQDLLPPGGARNALDTALWDLEAKVTGVPVWKMAALEAPRPILTTFGCGADTPERMAETARGYQQARAIKLKLTAEPVDADRVTAVRAARSDVWLGVDANQGFSRAFLERIMPTLVCAGVSLIEQPFRVGDESSLDGLDSPIPIAADESVQGLADLPALMGRFDVVNIKLDKCGGLSEALTMARKCHELGLKTMVGNMLGTSLAMAPAFLVGQLCDVVDLDGPLFLKADRAKAVTYSDGLIDCPDEVWGSHLRRR